MADNLVIVERVEPGLAVVTLNRPEAMNALSIALRRAIVAAFEEIKRDAEVRAVVLIGAGKGFCAGLDLRELSADSSGVSAIGADDPVAAVLSFSGPVIGAINGPAITGGLELALACDVRIASSAARFADTHGRVGVIPGWGLSQRLSRIVGLSRAKEMSLTGNFVNARQAETWGLVNQVTKPEDLLSTAIALAKDMLSIEPALLPALKSLIDDGYALPLEAALALELERSAAHNAALTPEALGARREGVLSRGRASGE